MIRTKKFQNISTFNKEKIRGKRILILGGLGMIGSNLACKLVAYDADVTIVDAFIEPFGANLFNIDSIKEKVNLNIADIRDIEAMKVLVKDKDIIFNLAGQVSHNDSIDNPLFDADLNYIGHLNVMENVKKFNPKAKVLFSGSRLQFGLINSIPVDEEHPLNPRTPYALNKTASEEMYKYYNNVHNIPTIVFRIANPYGIRAQMKHSKYSIVNYFIKQSMENATITIFGDGKQIRDYIYVEDLIDAFILASISDQANGETYNIGSGTGTSFIDMVETIVDVVDKGKIKHVPWPNTYLNVETGDYITNISKISLELGWKPTIELRDGIEKTFNYYNKYLKYYI